MYWHGYARLFVPFAALYWVNWWRRQKGWFFGDSEEET